MSIGDLPALNAALNLTSLLLLLTGFGFIRVGNVRWHKTCMISAFVVSIGFLASYLTYRIASGADKRFGGTGWIRPVYYFILITHVSLALTVPVLASRTLWLGLTDKLTKHRRWARWTFPIWVYVSVTGVLVYLLLFVLYGPAQGSKAGGTALPT